MGSIVKNVIRVGVIGAVGAGALVAIAGPGRVGAAMHQVRASINDQIDAQIDDPIALRAQLRDAEARFPAQIEAVEGDLEELKSQIEQFRRERDISLKVVDNTGLYLDQLQDAFAQAEVLLQTELASTGRSRDVVIAFRGEDYPLDQAYDLADEITRTHNAHAKRAEDYGLSLERLEVQEDRLAGVLSDLRTQQSTLQADLWAVEQEIEAFARNDRLIDLMEKHQTRIDRHERYEGVSLEAVKSRLDNLRARQESRLRALTAAETRMDFEAEAIREIQRDETADDRESRRTVKQRTAPTAREVIRITPGADRPQDDRVSDASDVGPVAAGVR